MEYYTEKEPLILAEYGRHVQDMVNHTLTISDKEERNKAAKTIVQIMTQLNPSYKDTEELQQKLWNDLFIISKFQLDVDSPFPKPQPKTGIRPEKVKYPDQNFRYKHYGKIIDGLIATAVKIENPEERQALTQMIANLMKKSYLNYNRDSVNEEMIVDQLTDMSKGRLTLDPEFRFHHTNDILSKSRKQNNNAPRQGGGGAGKKNKRKWKK